MIAKKQDLGALRWDDVRIFLAALRHGSLGAAGERLGLDTSTVSRRLVALEEALGARLFERSREGLTPTQAAELALPAAESMEAALGRLARDASGVETEAEGVVRLSVAPGMADILIAPALGRLRARHPKVRLELDATVRALDLTRHEADLALRSVPPRGADLVAKKLLTAPWIAVGSPALVASLDPLRAWDEAPWIAWDRELASFPPAAWFAKHAGKAEVVLRTSHFVSQLVAAETGLGLVLIPEPFLQLRALVPVRLHEDLIASTTTLPRDDLWLVGHRALRDLPRIAAVWEFVAEEIQFFNAPGVK